MIYPIHSNLQECPPSVNSQAVVLSSAVAFIAAVTILHSIGQNKFQIFLYSLLSLFAFQFTCDVFVRKVYREQSTGLEVTLSRLRTNFSITRIVSKLLGLFCTLALIGLVYVTIPMYESAFYKPFFLAVEITAPFIIPFGVIYLIAIDAWLREPEDDLWEAGQFFQMKWQDRNWTRLKVFSLGWVIKSFFLPLMISYFYDASYSFASSSLDINQLNAVSIVAFISIFALTLDLAFVSLGYLCTLRITDSHIRSVNPYAIGWIVTLLLYKPFSSLIFFTYKDGMYWNDWFSDNKLLLYTWAGLIILSKLGWVWSNISFGLRFSNLTHRGIITNGPYRIMKHPSYVFKNISWWLLSVPFLSSAGAAQALAHSMALIGFNLFYFWRARYEERHLSEDPRYIEYAIWMENNGIFRSLARRIPILSYTYNIRTAGIDISDIKLSPPQQ